VSAPLNIGILCHPTYGGSGVVASELALSLAARGHGVHLFSHAVPPRLARSPGPVRMHCVRGLPYPLFASPPHDLALASAVLDVHRNQGLDILHAHYALPHAVSAFLARSAAEAEASVRPAPRVVTTLHGTDITLVGSDPSYAPLTRFAIASSDGVTAVSESLACRTRQGFEGDGREVGPIEVIPNFVDTDVFHPGAGASQDNPALPRAVHVSNFRQVKRVPWLVEAFARATRGREAHLTLVGDGPDRAAAEAKAVACGLEGSVVFLGERDALAELLAPADIFLLASTEESFGLSALEALSSGTPVVATRAGGVPEVVLDRETGLLSDVDDAEGFAANIAALLFDPERTRTMGRAARADAMERFQIEGAVGRYEALYRRVLARPRGEGRQ